MTSKLPTYSDYKASGLDWLGDIPSHWKIVRTQYLFDIYSGSTPNSNEQIFWDGEIKWITPADFNTTDKYVSQGKRNLSQKGYNSCSTTLVPVGSIVFSKRAPIGKVCLTKTSLCTNQGCFTCVPKNVCVDYYYYLMSILEKIYNLYGSGSTFTEISAKDFSLFKLIVPSLAEQEAIAAYLDDVTGKIDALISEKRKQVEDIRAYRTSLITETVTHGLNPDAPLRPSGIDWLGDIPQHWETSKLKYIGEARNGLTYSPDDICEQGKGVLVLRSSNIQNEQLCLEDNVYVSKEVDELMMKEGDILICSRNGSASLVGKCAIIPKGVNASFGAFMMRYRSIINKRFTLYLVRTTLAQHKAQFATSTINQLTNAMIGNMQVAVPPLAEQQSIADFLDAKTAKIDELISELTKQIDELTEYKQAVITEAVTGKVDVRDYKPSN